MERYFHNFRALMNCIAQLDPDKTHLTVPQNLKSKSALNQTVLSWIKSTDNRTMLGYNIYQNGKRIGFIPNASFTVQKLVSAENGKFTVKAVDFEGNEPGFSKSISN